jgi:hypothetical protein
MQLKHSSKMKVQFCIKNIRNGLLDRLDQPSLISCRECDRSLKTAFGAMCFGNPIAGGCDSCPSHRDFLFEQYTNLYLVQFRLKNQVRNPQVSRLADVCESFGAAALLLQKCFEKDHHFFFRPIAEIARINFMHPASWRRISLNRVDEVHWLLRLSFAHWLQSIGVNEGALASQTTCSVG